MSYPASIQPIWQFRGTQNTLLCCIESFLICFDTDSESYFL